MIDLSQNGYSHEQVLEILKSTKGLEKTQYRIDIMRGGANIGTVDYTDCQIECSAENEVKYSATITIKPDDRINFNTDHLRPVLYLDIGGVRLEYAFTPLRLITQRADIRDGYSLSVIEAYDDTILLQGNSIGYIPYYPRGSVYTTVVSDLIENIGVAQVNIEPSGKYFSTEREDWAESDSVLEIINELLDEIGYHSLAINQEGVFYSGPILEPAINHAKIQYIADEKSIIIPGKTLQQDTYKKPNVFVGIVSNPDLDEVLRYVYTDSDPSSPTSTTNSQYVRTEVQTYNNIADAQTLADKVQRWAHETINTYEEVELVTAIMPHHELWEVVAVHAYGVNGIYQETGWSINKFGSGGQMTHQLRRVLN